MVVIRAPALNNSIKYLVELIGPTALNVPQGALIAGTLLVRTPAFFFLNYFLPISGFPNGSFPLMAGFFFLLFLLEKSVCGFFRRDRKLV